MSISILGANPVVGKAMEAATSAAGPAVQGASDTVASAVEGLASALPGASLVTEGLKAAGPTVSRLLDTLPAPPGFGGA